MLRPVGTDPVRPGTHIIAPLERTGRTVPYNVVRKKTTAA